MKKYLLFVSFLLLFITCIYLANTALKDDKKVNQNTTYEKSITNNGMTLKYSYLGNNTWNYKVNGTLPTPCDDISFQAIVRESFPEQVVITGYPKKLNPDTVCIQIIQDFEKTGTVNASEKATFQLIVALPD